MAGVKLMPGHCAHCIEFHVYLWFFLSHISRAALARPIFAALRAAFLHRGHSIKFAVAGTDLGNKANAAASCAFGELSLLTGGESEHTGRHRDRDHDGAVCHRAKLLPSMNGLKKKKKNPSILKCILIQAKVFNFFSSDFISSSLILFFRPGASLRRESLICVAHICSSC